MIQFWNEGNVDYMLEKKMKFDVRKKKSIRSISLIGGKLLLMTSMIRFWNERDEYYMLNEGDEEI